MTQNPRLFLFWIALFCLCLPGCRRVKYIKDISQVTITEQSGTILPELQLYQEIVISRDRVTLHRNGRTDNTEVNEGDWELGVDEAELATFLAHLESTNCSSIRRIEPAELDIGGDSRSYNIVYAGGKEFYLGYGRGVTYTNGELLVEPIKEFVKNLDFPNDSAMQYKDSGGS